MLAPSVGYVVETESFGGELYLLALAGCGAIVEIVGNDVGSLYRSMGE
jgi:hypothetical protein